MRASLFLGALSLIVIALVSMVNGASRPTVAVPNCDASKRHWGCDPTKWRVRGNGRIDRLTCNEDPKPYMYWATKVRRHGAYNIWAGPEDAKVTEYIPGMLMDINLRVRNYAFKYRGILVYAEDKDGNRVGEWVLPQETTPFFQLPYPNNHACRQSLMHNSAELKPLMSTWKWKAPPKGTGEVTFHCLIKKGDANTGDFYWPAADSGGSLKLTESTKRKPGQFWYLSKRGQSCTERCAEENLKCDRVRMERINSNTAIINTILPQSIPCHLPYVSNCGPLGATTGINGLCYYDDTRCAAQGRNSQPVTCDAKSGNSAIGLRMCNCRQTTLAPQTPGKTVIAARGAQDTSPATKSSASFLLMGLALLGLTMRSTGKMTTSVVLSLFLIALVTLPSAQAHNWQFSVGRSKDVASTQTPCPSRIQSAPHVQVGPNQEYEIEWSVGHTTPSYYVIVHSKDENRLREVSFDSIEKYFNDATPAQLKSLPVYHRRFAARGADFNAHNQYYRNGAPIPESSPDFIPRPEAFGLWRDDAQLFRYKSEFYQNNYAEYQNPAMPFVEAMFRMDHLVHRPVDADMVKLKIPGRGGFGSYVVQWLWRGYRDCIDVDYVNRQVKDIYGLPNPLGGYVRVDHCYFPDYREVHECFRIYNDVSVCERICNRRNGGCNGFIVMPRVLPPNRYNGQAALMPQKCLDDVPTSALMEDARKVDVCFTVRARFASETFGPTEIVHEGDPAYHSTCFLKGAGRLFADFVEPPRHQDIPWRHGTQCISCDAVNLNKNVTRMPKWPLTNDCRDCDREPARNTPPFNPPKLILREAGHQCDGMWDYYQNLGQGRRHHSCPGETWKECVKQVEIKGRIPDWNLWHFETECAAAAAKDSQCSDNIFTRDLTWLEHNGKLAVACYCITKKSCCNGCRPRKPGTDPQHWNVYTLDRGSS